MADVQETGPARYTQLEPGRERLLARLPPRLHRLEDNKRTALARELATPLEQEGHVPHAPDAFDHGVLSLALTRCIAHAGKHWGRELDRSRHLPWQGQWRRVEAVAEALRHTPPERFRLLRVRCRHGERQRWWAFTNVVRLTRYGRQRLVRVQESGVRRERPRLLRTEALHGQSGSVIEPWS
jgi:hypothetical protein